MPPPPGPAETKAELKSLADLISHNDAQAQQQIAFWDAGAPAYRWIDLINERVLAGTPTTAYPHRVYTYVAQPCMTRRSRRGNRSTSTTGPARASWITICRRHCRSPTARRIRPSMPRRRRPRRAVLAYFLPAEAQSFQTMAEQAGWSRVLAGLQYPSDYYAGLELGRRVAEQVIAKAKADGSDAVWTGTVPTGPVQMDRDQSRQRHGRELETAAADLAERVQTRAAAGVRLARSAGRGGDGSQLSANIRDQLQGVLLAKPGRSPIPGPTGTRTSGSSKTGSIRIRLASRASTR